MTVGNLSHPSSPRKRGSRAMGGVLSMWPWIPAFAGMTTKEKALLAAHPSSSSFIIFLPSFVLSGPLLRTKRPRGEGAPVPCHWVKPIQEV